MHTISLKMQKKALCIRFSRISPKVGGAESYFMMTNDWQGLDTWVSVINKILVKSIP